MQAHDILRRVYADEGALRAGSVQSGGAGGVGAGRAVRGVPAPDGAEVQQGGLCGAGDRKVRLHEIAVLRAAGVSHGFLQLRRAET